MHADVSKGTQTDMTKLIHVVAFRCFAKLPKSDKLIIAEICAVV
jgi:hypothetical protein